MNINVSLSYNIYIPYVNYGLLNNNVKSLLPSYYFNEDNDVKSLNIKDIINKFTENDFINLTKNKITQNVLNLLNSISSINLYKIINEYGFYLISDDILYDLFIPFDSFIMNKKKYVLYIDDSYFDNLNIKNYVICTKNNLLLSINKTKYFTNEVHVSFQDIKPQILSYNNNNIYYSNKIINTINVYDDFYMTYYGTL